MNFWFNELKKFKIIKIKHGLKLNFDLLLNLKTFTFFIKLQSLKVFNCFPLIFLSLFKYSIHAFYKKLFPWFCFNL